MNGKKKRTVPDKKLEEAVIEDTLNHHTKGSFTWEQKVLVKATTQRNAD